MQVYKYPESSFPAGALRQALWCIDFCFCLELRVERTLDWASGQEMDGGT